MGLTPIPNDNQNNNPAIDTNYVLRNESQKYLKMVTNLGGIPNIGGGASMGAWREAAKGTAVKDEWYNMQPGIVIPGAGKCIYIFKIILEVTDACIIGVRHLENGTTYGLAGNQTPLLEGVFSEEVKSQNNPSGGTIEFDFVKEEGQPRKVKYGEQISIFGATNSLTAIPTKQTNYLIGIKGVTVTNDENYNAPFFMVTCGDSIQVPVADVGELEYGVRSGAIHGIWPVIVQRHLLKFGIDARWASIALGGSNIAQWEIKTVRGLFRSLRPHLFFMGSGMNDCASISYFRTTTGVDGIFTNAYKNIIREYFLAVPDGSFIVRQVTDSDEPGRLMVFATGIYAGLTRIAAIRLEVIAVVTEIKAENPKYDIVLSDCSPAKTFYASQKTNYVTAEQAVDKSIHPNARIGQPKMAIEDIKAVELTTFFNENKVV